MFSYACLLIWSSIVSVLLAPQLVSCNQLQVYIDTNNKFLLLHGMTLLLLFAALMTLSKFSTWITLMTHVFLSMITGQADGYPHSSMMSFTPCRIL